MTRCTDVIFVGKADRRDIASPSFITRSRLVSNRPIAGSLLTVQRFSGKSELCENRAKHETVCSNSARCSRPKRTLGHLRDDSDQAGERVLEALAPADAGGTLASLAFYYYLLRGRKDQSLFVDQSQSPDQQQLVLWGQ